MKIMECYIESFGKIKDKKISFSDGLNCIKDDNGSGKTTLSVFIKVMLYGMGDTKKPSLEENDRKHYLPWDGSRCGGSLTFLAGGKKYRIERSFGQKASEDTVTLFDLALGRPSQDFAEPIGESLFGIDKEGFERTVFLSERFLPPKSDNKSVSAKLSDLVGSDGDIGVMDEAIRILENQRKYYQKKGGVGEIANVKQELFRTEDELARLDSLGTQLKTEQTALYEANERVREVKAKIKSLTEVRERALAARADGERRERYKRLLRTIEEDTKKRDELIAFFGGAVPTFSEIEAAGNKAAEARRLRADAAEGVGEEYGELSVRFRGILTPERVERAERALERVEDTEQKRASQRASELMALFSKRIPKKEEVDRLISDSKQLKKTSFVNITLLILGIFLVLTGVLLGVLVSPIIYIVSLVGALSLTAGLVIYLKSKRAMGEWKRGTSSLLESISDCEIPASDLLVQLGKIRAALDEMEDIPTASDEDMRVLYDLVELFDKKDSLDLISAVREIISSYKRYQLLSTYEEYRRGDGQRRLAESERLESEVAAFLAPYKLSGADAFSQLSEARREYARLSERIVETRREATILEGDGLESSPVYDNVCAAETEQELQKLELELNSLLRNGAVRERQLASISEELDSRELLCMRRDELTERLAKYTDNYKIILLTKDYLTRAKDAVTSKYLGKTKASFEQYAELIGAADGEYDMDTSFAVMRREGARSQPVEAYSRGTRDLFNVAARFALIDSLYESESPFVILDDPFAAFDDRRAARALGLISEISKKRQIIYFTCSSSRAI